MIRLQRNRILAAVLAATHTLSQSDGAIHNSKYLSKDDIIDFLSDGYILIKDVFPEARDPDFLEEFEAAKVEASKAYHKFAIDELKCPTGFIDMVDEASPEEALKGCIESKSKKGSSTPEATFYQLIDLHSYSPRIRDVSTGERFGAIASDLLQIEKVRLYMTSAFRKVPSKNRAEEKLYNKPTYTHTDLIQVPVDTNDYLSFWCPLRDVTSEDSVLSYVKKSHRDKALHYVHHGRYEPPEGKKRRTTFEQVDGDGDGRISRDESTTHFLSQGRREMAMNRTFFDSQDADGDGFISRGEFEGNNSSGTVETNEDEEGDEYGREEEEGSFSESEDADSGGSSPEKPEDEKTETGQNPHMDTFNGIDADGDGKISYEEAKAHFRTKEGTEIPSGFFEGEDADGDGFVSLQEFLREVDRPAKMSDEERERREARSAARERRDKVDRFYELDADGDGKISFEEAAAMDIAPGFFRGEDADGDGSVSLEEFLHEYDHSDYVEDQDISDEEKERNDARRVAWEFEMLNDRRSNRLPVHVYDEIGLGDCVVHHGWLDHAATSQGMKGGPREAVQFSYIHGDGKKLEKKEGSAFVSERKSYEFRYQKWYDEVEVDAPIDHPALPIAWPPKLEEMPPKSEQHLGGANETECENCNCDDSILLDEAMDQ